MNASLILPPPLPLPHQGSTSVMSLPLQASPLISFPPSLPFQNPGSTTDKGQVGTWKLSLSYIEVVLKVIDYTLPITGK